MTTERQTVDKHDLVRSFKIHPTWHSDPHPYAPDNLLENISFVFTMHGFPGLYFKLNKPLPDNYGIGMDCFQFAFDNDNGIYINDGDMRFNDFMGQQITDSGTDAIGFIKEYLQSKQLAHLIK